VKIPGFESIRKHRALFASAVSLLVPLLTLSCLKKKSSVENDVLSQKNAKYGLAIAGSENGNAWELQSVEVAACQEKEDAWCDTDGAFSQDELNVFASDYRLARSGWRSSSSDVLREIESLAHLKKSGLERDLLAEVIKADKVASRQFIEKVFPARAKNLWQPLVKKNACKDLPTENNLVAAEKNVALSHDQLYQRVSPTAPKVTVKQLAALWAYSMDSTQTNQSLRKDPSTIFDSAEQIRRAIDAFANDEKPELLMVRVLDRAALGAQDCGTWTAHGFNGFTRDPTVITHIAEEFVTKEPVYIFLAAGQKAPYVSLGIAGRHAAQNTSDSRRLLKDDEDEFLFDHETQFLNQKTLWFKDFSIALMVDQGKSRPTLPPQ